MNAYWIAQINALMSTVTWHPVNYGPAGCPVPKDPSDADLPYVTHKGVIVLRGSTETIALPVVKLSSGDCVVPNESLDKWMWHPGVPGRN